MPAIAFQLRAQGFNGIRLPFTFSDLRAPPKSTWAKQGCEKVTLGASAPGDGAPAAAAGQQQPPRRCSWYLPDSSSLDRYLWSVQWFVANGYYVLLEARPAPGDEARVSEAAFADAWRALWRSAACLPNFKSDLEGRVFVDPMGAPDAAGHRWEPVTLFDGSVVPGLTSLYLGVMDAIWADTPSAPLFFVNGAGQGGASTWGSGFATDKATIAVNDFSDPNPFFQALLGKPYRASVVLSPAVYGSDAPAPPAASYAPPSWPMGPSPVKVMDTTFAFLAREGYCLGADCQRFPVAVGEFASRLKGAPELGALNAFAEHLTNAGVDFGGVGTWRFWGFEPALPGAS
ncbi:MAG: hypothetical protein J3K34DRAFT_443952 [Monoraphidium minutum]|nr:MAG: hypothetical protein J3K34DRAFT_443952 [Monoraphidium minutum]